MLLTSCQNNIKITSITLLDEIIDDSSEPNVFQPEDIQLPYLTKLDICDDALENDRVAKLCEKIGRYSPLKSLRILVYNNPEHLKRFMGTGGLQSVEELEIWFGCDFIAAEDVNYFCARIMEIPRIKKLDLYRCQMDSVCRGGIEAIINHFADSLEYLIGYYLPCFNKTTFPKLQEIEDHYREKIVFSYPVDRYPVLKTFHCCSPTNLAYSVVEESPGVDTLVLDASDLNKDELLKFICAAGTAFPQISSLIIDSEEKFTRTMLSVICKSFPKLTSLELRVKLKDDRTLSGLRLIVDEWLEEGWPLEKIPREVSLLDLTGLQKLTLGSRVIITRHLFLYCLSKIPKLQYLAFYWNGDVSAVDVRDGVGHLRRIKIDVGGSPRKPWVEEMERLRKMLPMVVELVE